MRIIHERSTMQFSRRYAHWILLAPSLLFLAIVMGYPLLRGLQLSFTETNSLTPTVSKGVGLENYQNLLQSPGFIHSLTVTVKYAVSSVVGALSLGLATALLMNRSVKGKYFIRGAITLPWAAPPIAVVLIFSWMFNPQYGVINAGLHALKIVPKETHWLDSPTLALPSLVFITVWMTFPLTSLIFLAALQSVSKELYEAAKIDGAGSFKLFRYVTFPFMRPTIYVMTLLLSIWALRRFDLIWVLTQGGPVDSTTTLVVRLFRESFEFGNLGYGATIGTVGFVLSVFCTVFYFLASRRVEDSNR